MSRFFGVVLVMGLVIALGGCDDKGGTTQGGVNASPAPDAGNERGRRNTYQQVAIAITSSDFEVLRSNLTLQRELTFENLEKNWDRAQKVFRRMYPTLDEITIIKSFDGKNGSRYWIVEFNTVDEGNKHIKSYIFTPDSSNKSGWKLSTTKHSGSYNYPDGFEIRDSIVKDIVNKIQSE